MKPIDSSVSTAEKTAVMNLEDVRATIAAARAMPETAILGDQRSVVARVLQNPPAAMETIMETPFEILIHQVKSGETPYEKKLEKIRCFDFSPYRTSLSRVFAAAMADPAGGPLQQAILDRTRSITFPAQTVLEILKTRSSDNRKFQQLLIEKIDESEELNPEIQLQIIAALSHPKTIEILLKKLGLRMVVREPANIGTLPPKAALNQLREQNDPQKKTDIISIINPSLDPDPSIFIQLLATANHPADITLLFRKYNITLERAPQMKQD